MTVQVTPQTLQFVANEESFNPNAYADGAQTSIGYGTKAQPGETSITQADAQQRLGTELQQAADYINSIAPNANLPPNVADSLISAAFNLGSFTIGPNGAPNTAMIQAIQQGNVPAIAQHLAGYTGTTAGQSTAAGVQNRRNEEVSVLTGNLGAAPNYTSTSAYTNGQAPIQVASAITPPHPNLSPNDSPVPQFNWGDVSPVSVAGLLGSPAASRGVLNEGSPGSALYGFGATPVSFVQPAANGAGQAAQSPQAALPTTQASNWLPPSLVPSSQSSAQLPAASASASPSNPGTQAASWLPPSLLPGGSGFVDNLTADPSYQKTPDLPVQENSAVPPGPYGAQSIITAAMAGDPAALAAAENNVMGAALKQNGLFGIGQAQTDLQNYFNTTEQVAPGAFRQAQTQLNNNPSLINAVPPQLRPMVQQAFSSLPPAPSTSVPLPNLAPTYTGPATPPPLVASNPANPLQPKMASLNSATQPQPPLFSSSPLSIWDPTYGTGTQQPTATDQQKAAATASLAASLQQQQSGDSSSSYQSSPGQTSSFDPAALNLPSSILSDPTTAMLFNAQSGNTFGSSFGSSNDLPGRTAIQPSSGSSIPGNSLLGYGSPLPSSAFTAGLAQPVANPFGQSSPYLFGGIPTGAGIGFAAPPPIVPTLPRQATVAAAAPARPAPIIPMPNMAPTPGVNAGYPTLPGATQGTYSGTQGSNTYTFDPTSGQGVYYDPSSGQQFSYSSTDQSDGGNWSNSIGNGF